MYSTSELDELHRAGKAHKLPTGAILPTNTPQDVAAAIAQAKAAHGAGSDDDDPGFRQHLTRRAAAYGLQRLVPSTWSQDSAGKSAATLAALGNAAALERQAAVLSDPVTAARARQRAAAIRDQAATPAEHLAKAARYDRAAEQVTDPRDREAYRQLAAQERDTAAAR